MTGPVQSSSNAPYGGYVFSGPATGPAPIDFNKSPGIWQTLYNDAAMKIGLPQEKADAKLPPNSLVVRELERQNNVYHAQQRGPAAHAEKLVTEARSSSIFGDSVDTPRLAAEIVALRRDLPNDALQIEREIMTKLGNAGDQSRFADDLRKAAGYPAAADAALRSMANTGVAQQPMATRAQLNTDVNAIITDATSKDTFSVKGEVFAQPRTFSTARVVAQLSALAEAEPAKAQLIRSELTTRLTPQEADDMNRMLAGEGGFFENMSVGLNDPGDAAIGAAKGVGNDGIGILNLLARAGAAKAAADAEQNAAMQSLFGMDKAAAQSRQSADALYKASQTDVIPSIPYKNAAQQGGANIATVAELAGGAKAVYSGGKWALRNVPELLAKRGDDVAEVVKPLVRQLDQFDELAAKAKIDMPHILDGHLNAKGKAVGFHSRTDGIDPPNSRMTEQVGLKNPQDVYVGKVEINGISKKQISTFYPDHMTPKEIEAAVRHAYADALRKGEVKPDGSFVGDSKLGFEITGIVRNNEIPTAYPIF